MAIAEPPAEVRERVSKIAAAVACGAAAEKVKSASAMLPPKEGTESFMEILRMSFMLHNFNLNSHQSIKNYVCWDAEVERAHRAVSR